MDILVFTPVYRLEPETVAALSALEWEGPLSFLLQRDNPYADGRENILHQYRRGRDVFLAGSWDAVAVIESDIIPPADALTKLAALDADLAYGLYSFRNWPLTVNVLERYQGEAKNHGEPLTTHPNRYERACGKQVPCSGAGLGCVLVKRRVLEQIEFRHEPKGGHCDSYFTGDVYAAGFKMMADMTVICGHKTPDGEILWPPNPKNQQPKSKLMSLASLG